MPINLPEEIDRHLFRTIDGRMTTEAETTFAAAQSIVSGGRNLSDPALLTRAVRVLVMYGHYVKWPRPVVFPAIGMLQACFDRQLYRGRGIRAQFAGLMFRLVHARLESEALRRYGPSCEGWNDYHLAYWFMTADRQTLRELHRRATINPFNPGVRNESGATIAEIAAVRKHAAWLIDTVRRQYPDFDEAMRTLETRFKRPVTLEDPTEGPTPPGAA